MNGLGQKIVVVAGITLLLGSVPWSARAEATLNPAPADTPAGPTATVPATAAAVSEPATGETPVPVLRVGRFRYLQNIVPGWQKLHDRYPALLGTLAPVAVTETRVRHKRSVITVLAVRGGQESELRRVCQQLSAKGRDCAVMYVAESALHPLESSIQPASSASPAVAEAAPLPAATAPTPESPPAPPVKAADATPAAGGGAESPPVTSPPMTVTAAVPAATAPAPESPSAPPVKAADATPAAGGGAVSPPTPPDAAVQAAAPKPESPPAAVATEPGAVAAPVTVGDTVDPASTVTLLRVGPARSRQKIRVSWERLRDHYGDRMATVTPLLVSATSARQSHRSARFVLALQGPSEAALRQLCDEMENSGRTCTLEQVAPAKIHPLPSAPVADAVPDQDVAPHKVASHHVTQAQEPAAPTPIERNQIMISIADRRLYYAAPDGRLLDFPVGVGRTRRVLIFGETQVIRKREHPTWYPTSTMRQHDPRLPAEVGPGPHNPMGDYALYLGWPYIRIHGTNQPNSVGRAESHGCYRMLAEDIKTLFNLVDVNTRVKVVNPSVRPVVVESFAAQPPTAVSIVP